MKKQLFKIAGGNATLLVWDCLEKCRKEIIDNYLGKVEQIGFVFNNTLTMMGNELCINSTLALASSLNNKGELTASGIKNKVTYENKKGITYIRFNLPYKKLGRTILFEGIGFIYSEKKVTKGRLLKLSNQYQLPAFGNILFKKNKLVPYLYVKKTNSLFKETACGSGSIALSLLENMNNVTQPTGEVITINKTSEGFTVGAKVNKY